MHRNARPALTFPFVAAASVAVWCPTLVLCVSFMLCLQGECRQIMNFPREQQQLWHSGTCCSTSNSDDKFRCESEQRRSITHRQAAHPSYSKRALLSRFNPSLNGTGVWRHNLSRGPLVGYVTIQSRAASVAAVSCCWRRLVGYFCGGAWW